MKSIHFKIGVSVDGEAVATLADVFQQAIEKGTVQISQSITEAGRIRGARERVASNESPRSAFAPAEKQFEGQELLVDTRGIAELLGVSERTVSTMNKNRSMPKAIKIGS